MNGEQSLVDERFTSLGRPGRISFSTSNHPEDLKEAALAELVRLERKFSAQFPGSFVSQINQQAGSGSWTTLDAEAKGMFELSKALWQQSSHQFDPSISALEEINGRLSNAHLERVGYRSLETSDDSARLQVQHCHIDLSHIVRAYAVDRLLDLLRNQGVEHAMVNVGRSTGTIGRQADGANWLVGVKHPFQGGSTVRPIKLNDAHLCTWGDFEKATLSQGERFGTALSPIDGLPIPGPLSVIVKADSALAAHGAATVARLKTERAASQWLQSLPYDWMVIDRSLACHGPLAPN